MRKDCHICLSEGFEALNRVLVTVKGKSKIATLYFSNDGFCNQERDYLKYVTDLHAKEGDEIIFTCSARNHEKY
jgi:thymidine phosphorylase